MVFLQSACAIPLHAVTSPARLLVGVVIVATGALMGLATIL